MKRVTDKTREILEAIAVVVKSKELKEYADSSVENFASVVLGGRLVSAKKQIESTTNLLFSIPDILFWDKMKCFLCGTYSDFNFQKKIFEKFSEEEWIDFTKRQIHIVNEIEDDAKIAYFSNLTKSFAQNFIDLPLYFKLAKALQGTTREELRYLSTNINRRESPKDIFMMSLMQYGLATSYNLYELNWSGSIAPDIIDFTMLAHCMDRFAIDFENEDKYSYDEAMLKLVDLPTDGLHRGNHQNDQTIEENKI